MSTGFLLAAIVGVLFFSYISPLSAGNLISCQVFRYLVPGAILISSDVLYPEISGRVPDEDKNFTGSVKTEPGILDISNIIGRIPDEDKNFTGSVKEPSILNITQTQLNMSLIEAANNAEKSIGNDSSVIDAKLASRNGYIVYELLLVGKNPDDPFTWLIIDPGSSEEFAQITCKCEECKQFAGKWICTDCKCTQ